MTRQPSDFDTLSNPSRLWSVSGDDGTSSGMPLEPDSRVQLNFEQSHLTLDIRVDGNQDACELTPESAAELRDALTAWLQWKGHDKRCEHTMGQFRPYCGEMVCHNYAGRWQSRWEPQDLTPCRCTRYEGLLKIHNKGCPDGA